MARIPNREQPNLEIFGAIVHENRPLEFQDWFFLAFKLVSAGFCVYFYFHSPFPGISIACLAVVAAALSVHKDPRGWQKAMWLLLIGGFLWAELHAIRVDRAEADRHAEEERATQDKNFSDVRTQQNANFGTTAKTLETAITGIQSTLHASSALLRLSQPQAVIHVEGVDFVDTPKEIAAGKTYWFNVRYVNRGLAPATNLHMSEEVFVDKKDDLTAQQKLAGLFEAKWQKVTRSSRIAVSGEESFQSASYTVSQQDLNRMANHEASFYVLSRVEYSDNQGRWRTDDCELFQNDETMGFTSSVRHWCTVFKNQRAPVPADMQERIAAPSGLHHQ